jgi:hypothetical protein
MVLNNERIFLLINNDHIVGISNDKISLNKYNKIIYKVLNNTTKE